MMSISREEAFVLLKSYLSNKRTIAHCLAAEAVLRALAQRLGEDEEKWGMAGLLHDIDLEIIDDDLSQHGLVASEILKGKGVPEEILEAIIRHNESASPLPRSQPLHHALAAGETITGLIVATAMVYPDKKLASVKPQSIIKRMKEKLFSASIKRENIRECEKIGIPLADFAALALAAMLPLSEELGI